MLTLQLTEDGSYTFYSQEFKQAFHSTSGAKEEAEKKFVQPCLLREKAAHSSSLQILDICYGLGYNTAAAIEAISQSNPNCYLEIIALELEDLVPKTAISHQLLDSWPHPIPSLLAELAQQYHLETLNFKAQLLLGDARLTLLQVYQSGFRADAIFLDPFSPAKCPQLWTIEFITQVAQCLKPTGYLATYSCAASIRTALQEAGLKIGAAPNVGRRSPGTIASFAACNLPPLSLQELEHLQTKAAIPYRDPSLRDTAQTIEQRRLKEQETSFLEPSSHWKKRWNQLK